ncbi:hypothetical protein [Haloarcula salinisoli]|uniref:Uncharacterized protein n=1 Tax=Haloarcula salinisoli TaxID=2487746 RepID=A0A8J8C8N3_9EURY|nr:hypothetical protein [Halomicroarcula salinisoli]MBX0304586.1 hypothetical protein [Halomicroarcula salinisoli]
MLDDWPVVGLLAAVGVLLLVTAGVVLTGVFGFFGSGGVGVGTDSPAMPTPSATPGAETPAPPRQPFTLETRAVEECGMLCRNVTSAVTNEQPTVARDVTVRTRLYAGNDTDGEVRWEGTERVARLGPGETYQTTQRVELPLEAALAIREADGWVTIRTTVETAEQSVTVTDRREVG